MTQSRLVRRVGLLVALAAVYFIAGKLGLKLAFVNASATPVWPCTGIALAAFVLLGYDVWPAILASSFLVNLTTAGTAATAIGIAVGNTLEGMAGAYLVNRFARGRRAFNTTLRRPRAAGSASRTPHTLPAPSPCRPTARRHSRPEGCSGSSP